MPFTHHSHSGQFCSHARDSLEDVVKEAINQGMEIFCMTEHMPRDREAELYPEEVAEGITPKKLHQIFDNYVQEAKRLQEKYQDRLKILIGTETDWFKHQESQEAILNLLKAYEFDFFIGSVHHVHTVPIDYSKELYEQAVTISKDKHGDSQGDGEQLLAADYFDLQFSMLQSLRPPVVGHFDLIRLLSDFEKEGRRISEWPAVWQKALRNLKFVSEYGGCLEINSAGLRKGLREPYPCKEICQAFLGMSGRFVLSDDSHGIAQVGHSYGGTINFLELVGIKEVAVFEKIPEAGNQRFGAAPIRLCSILEIRQSGFSKRLESASTGS